MMMLSREKKKWNANEFERANVSFLCVYCLLYSYVSDRFRVRVAMNLLLVWFSIPLYLPPVFARIKSSHLWFFVFLFFHFSIHFFSVASEFIRAYVCSLMGLPIAWPVNPFRLSTYRIEWRAYCFVVHEIHLFSLLWFTHSFHEKKRTKSNSFTLETITIFSLYLVRLLPPQPTRLCYTCVVLR